MSVAASLVNETGSFIAFESQVSEGSLARACALPKGFVKEAIHGDLVLPIGFGLCGSPFIQADLFYKFKLPRPKNFSSQLTTEETDAYVFGSLAPKLCKAYKKGDREFRGLVVVNGHAYSLDSVFSTSRILSEYDAVGDGIEVVLGAMCMASSMVDGPLESRHLAAAIVVAGELISSCNHKVSVIEVPGPEFVT